jgi:hypothetical protein
VQVNIDKKTQWSREVNASEIGAVLLAGESVRCRRARRNGFDETDRTGWVEPIALFFAFQKSTVFEKVTKHRETVAERNLFARHGVA